MPDEATAKQRWMIAGLVGQASHLGLRALVDDIPGYNPEKTLAESRLKFISKADASKAIGLLLEQKFDEAAAILKTFIN